MNTHKSLLTTAAVTAFACSLAFGQQQPGQQTPGAQQQEQQSIGQPPPPAPPAQQQQQQSQQQQAQQQAILGSDISDQQVQSQDGQQLGTLDDLAVSLENGQVAYLLISSQGEAGGQGAQQWKPIPPEAIEIKQQGGQVEITANIGQQEWQNVPTVSEQEVPELADQQRAQEIYQAFNQQPSQQQAAELTLASNLMENTLSNQEGQEIGQITDVVLDAQGKQLHFIVIQPEHEQGQFAAAPQAVQKTGEQEFQLSLSQEDFQQAQEITLAEVEQQAQQAQGQQGQVFRLEESQQASLYGSPEQRGQRRGQEATQMRVRQPAPQVRVEQPQPEVQVTQPPPEVQVTQPQPEVQVTQPEPRVRVQQGEPQVEVEQAEPEVRVQQEGQPEVQVQQQGQPEVYIEREAQQEQRQRERRER